MRIFLVTLTVAFTSLAAADDFETSRATPWYEGDGSAWQLEVGLGVEVEPDYVGSDDLDAGLDATLVLSWRPNARWRLTATPATVAAVWKPDDRWLAQLVIEAEEGREAGETADLKALEDGADTTEAELTVGRRLGSKSFAYATYQPKIENGGKGQVWFAGVGSQLMRGPSWVLTGVLDVSWGDDEHMATEFGLTADQAARLNLSAYDVGGGVKSSTAGLRFEWRPSPQLILESSIEAEHYFDSAADSPLLRELGASRTFEAEVSLIYRF